MRFASLLVGLEQSTHCRGWDNPYGLETNDPWLAELVRRVDAGETVIDTVDFSEAPETSEDDSSEEKIERSTEMIGRAGDEPGTKSAALLVLMATLENANHPKAHSQTRRSTLPSLAAVS